MGSGQLSWEGRQKLAATPLAESKLGELTGRMSKGERRSFWLGVLLLDGAVSLDDALRRFEPIPHEEAPAPEVERRLHVVREVPTLCECGRPVRARRSPTGKRPTCCDSDECPKGRKANKNSQGRELVSERRQRAEAVVADSNG
jgi:hypothetical protein